MMDKKGEPGICSFFADTATSSDINDDISAETLAAGAAAEDIDAVASNEAVAGPVDVAATIDSD